MILQLSGPATIDIKISEQNETETVVDIISTAKHKGFFSDPTLIWKNILIKKVKKRLH